VVSPGGVGFDISCGVRLLVSPDLTVSELRPHLTAVMDDLGATVIRGPGPGDLWPLHDRRELERVLVGGAQYAVEQGHGCARDLDAVVAATEGAGLARKVARLVPLGVVKG
jgi:tRNA-splicing ligase RtcB